MSQPIVPLNVTSYIEFCNNVGDYFYGVPDGNSYLYVNGSNFYSSAGLNLFTWGGSSWNSFFDIPGGSSIGSITNANFSGNVPIYSNINKTSYFYSPKLSQVVNVDTNRQIIKKQSQIVNVDTKRIITKIQRNNIDTKRKIYKLFINNLDTNRIIGIASINYIDTKRKIKKSLLSSVDTLRKIVITKPILIDTKRNLTILNNLLVDTKRVIFDSNSKALKKCYLQMDLFYSADNSPIKIVQNDSITVLFHLSITKNDTPVDLIDSIVNIKIKRPDGVINSSKCIARNTLNGIVEYSLNSIDTCIPGMNEFVLEILSDDGRVTTQKCKYTVIEELGGNNAEKA